MLNVGLDEDGKKITDKNPEFSSSVVIYDAELSLATPNNLWLSSTSRFHFDKPHILIHRRKVVSELLTTR